MPASDPSAEGSSQHRQEAPGLSPAELYPPIEPPQEGMVIKLFAVPLGIVAVIVLGYVLVFWLVNRASDPQAYVDQIKKDNAKSWQAAHDLAIEIGRDAKLRQNEKLARSIAEHLESLIARPCDNAEEARLRYYLCKTLGEFESTFTLPILVSAAESGSNQHDLVVRVAAVESLGSVVFRQQSKGEPLVDKDRTEVSRVVVDCTRVDAESWRDADEKTRSAAQRAVGELRTVSAYVLGVLGDGPSVARLATLASDLDRDVRFNATAALARLGKEEAVGGLVEMIDPDVTVAEQNAAEGDARKLALIRITGLAAAEKLVETTPGVDISALRSAIRKLKQRETNGEVAAECDRVLKKLDGERGSDD